MMQSFDQAHTPAIRHQFHPRADRDLKWTLSVRRELAHVMFYEKHRLLVRGQSAPPQLNGQWIYIHTAKKRIDPEIRDAFSSYLDESYPDANELNHGVILGRVRLRGAFRCGSYNTLSDKVVPARDEAPKRWGAYLNFGMSRLGQCQKVKTYQNIWCIDSHELFDKPVVVGAGTGGLYDYEGFLADGMRPEREVA